MFTKFAALPEAKKMIQSAVAAQTLREPYTFVCVVLFVPFLLLGLCGVFNYPSVLFNWVMVALALMGFWVFFTIGGPLSQKARKALSGNTDEKEFVKMMEARRPSTEEQFMVNEALKGMGGQGVQLFEALYVIPGDVPVAYMISKYLFVTRQALQSEFLRPMIASELGQLNLGVAYFLASLSIMAKRRIIDFQTAKNVDVQKLGKAARGAMKGLSPNSGVGGLIGLAMAAHNMSQALEGTSINGILEQAKEYCEKWTYEADKLALLMVERRELEAYLEYLAEVEVSTGGLLWRAPAVLRLDKIRYSH